jgi:hypothetical protein
MNTVLTESAAASGTPPATSVHVNGLPASIAERLHRDHEALARAITTAQNAEDGGHEEDATVPVDGLPEATRQFLWNALRKYHPALAKVLRGPAFAEARASFSAQLHLCVVDLVKVIHAAFTEEDETSALPRKCRRHAHADRRLGA